MCCTLSQRARRLTDIVAYGFYQVLSTTGIWSNSSAKKWGHILSRRTFLKQNLTLNKRWMKMGGFSQTLDQDLWVVGDRSREEGVPSRFGRGTGMCPLIRLGNCGGRERGWELARRGRRLYESCFPVRNCSIVTALVSCFFYSLCLFLFVSVPCTSTTEGEVNIICPQRIRYGVCPPGEGVWCMCVCVSQMRSSSQTSPPCSNWLPWAQTGSIHRISSPSHKRWNRTPLLDLLTKSRLVSQPLKSTILQILKTSCF